MKILYPLVNASAMVAIYPPQPKRELMSQTAAKLVRDKIPEIIKKDGRTPIVQVIQGDVLLSALNNKLLEEHQEFMAAADKASKLEELADLLEVIYGLCNQLGTTKAELHQACDRKREARGGFELGLFYKGCEEQK